MMQAGSGAFALPFPNGHEEKENPFKMAGRLLGEINALRTLMFKQIGVDFSPQKFNDNAHGHSEDGFHYKLGFKHSGHEQDPVFEWIQSLQDRDRLPALYVRSDDTIKHPYPHEIFLKHENIDNLLNLVANKTQSLQKKIKPRRPEPLTI